MHKMTSPMSYLRDLVKHNALDGLNVYITLETLESGYVYGGNVTTTMFCRELYPMTFATSFN